MRKEPRKPYNVEYLHRGMITKTEEWPLVIAALIFFGIQFSLPVLFYFLR